MQTPTIILKPGRDKAIRQRHPWIFSGAIGRVAGTPTDGAQVAVQASDGTWLAWGTWSGASQIRVRVWSWDPDQPVSAELLRDRIGRAIAGRAALAADPATTAYRLVFSSPTACPA